MMLEFAFLGLLDADVSLLVSDPCRSTSFSLVLQYSGASNRPTLVLYPHPGELWPRHYIKLVPALMCA